MNRPSWEYERLAKQIADEASHWLVRLHDPTISDAERQRINQQFRSWILLSDVHVEKYLASEEAWQAVLLADPQLFSPGALLKDIVANPEPDNVVLLPSSSGAECDPESLRDGSLFARWRARLVTCFAALFLGAAVWWSAHDLLPTTIRTGIGELRSVELPDGSLVTLNTESKVVIDFGSDERRVRLLGGEAQFSVTKDARRPFTVSTPQAAVRAVGTTFNVRTTKESRTTVAVIEGRVLVTPRDRRTVSIESVPPSGQASGPSKDPSAQTATTHVAPVERLELEAGGTATILNDGAMIPNVGPTLEQVRAWPKRRLVARDEPLAGVIEELHRYHETKLRVDDPWVARQKLSGTFEVADLETFVMYLEGYRDVTCERLSDGTMILARRVQSDRTHRCFENPQSQSHLSMPVAD